VLVAVASGGSPLVVDVVVPRPLGGKKLVMGFATHLGNGSASFVVGGAASGVGGGGVDSRVMRWNDTAWRSWLWRTRC
jgi:hypothetical protein